LGALGKPFNFRPNLWTLQQPGGDQVGLFHRIPCPQGGFPWVAQLGAEPAKHMLVAVGHGFTSRENLKGLSPIPKERRKIPLPGTK
jgi:hypothetical protein